MEVKGGGPVVPISAISLIGFAGLALGAGVLLPVAGAAEPAGNGDATGTLRLDVRGTSSEVSIDVTGPEGAVPDGYSKTVTSDHTLRGLTPGTFTITPSVFVTPSGKPLVTVSRHQVKVKAGATATVTVTYSTRLPVRAVEANADITCAVLRSGQVRCWGASFLEGVPPISFPMTVVKGTGEIRAVAVASRNICALRRDGAVKCWGGMYLGNGTRRSSAKPVRVTGLDDAVAISAGGQHTCAVTGSGRVWCWGWNTEGQLGNGTTTAAKAPVKVKGIRTATAVAAGWRHTCALLADGTARCWGFGEHGQLGNGHDNRRELTPVTVRRLANAKKIAAGGEHTCVVLSDKTMKCWGLNESGQLGDAFPYMEGDDMWSAFPVRVKDVDSATALTAGGGHSCARLQGGALVCWGGNTFGELGIGVITQGANRPVPVIRIDDGATLGAGELHTCAVRSGGTLSCWGYGGAGQLGNGQWDAQQPTPQQVAGFGR